MKSSTIIWIVIALLVVVLGVYWYTPSSNTYQSPTPQPTPAAQEVAQPTTINSTTVDISNYAFRPTALAVRAGTKVTWTNNDTVAHTVTSDTEGIFDSGRLEPGQSFTYTFATVGAVSYHCALHPMMKASVVVQ